MSLFTWEVLFTRIFVHRFHLHFSHVYKFLKKLSNKHINKILGRNPWLKLTPGFSEGPTLFHNYGISSLQLFWGILLLFRLVPLDYCKLSQLIANHMKIVMYGQITMHYVSIYPYFDRPSVVYGQRPDCHGGNVRPVRLLLGLFVPIPPRLRGSSAPSRPGPLGSSLLALCVHLPAEHMPVEAARVQVTHRVVSFWPRDCAHHPAVALQYAQKAISFFSNFISNMMKKFRTWPL